MVWAAALIVLADLPAQGPIRSVGDENELFWSADTVEGDRLIVIKSSVLHYTDGSMTLWLSADHKRNKKVAYRRSETRLRFDCRGMFQMEAITTFDASEAVLDSDDAPPGLIISGKEKDIWRKRFVRPYTVFDELAQTFCPKQK